MTFAPIQNLFTQPDAPADKTLYVGRNPPAGQFGFVQWFGNPVSRMISTNSQPINNDPGLISEEAEWEFLGIASFAQPGNVLGVSLELEIPWVHRTGNAVPYSELYFFFADAASNLGFWYGCTLYDIRGARIIVPGVQAPEEGTGVAIVTGLVGGDGQFSTDLGGEVYQDKPWFGFKTFIFGVSAANLAAAIAAIKAADPSYAAMSADPTRIELTGVNFEAEIARRNGQAWMAFTVAKMSVDLYQVA